MKNRIVRLVLAVLCIVAAIPVTSLSVSADVMEFITRPLLPNKTDDYVSQPLMVAVAVLLTMH